MIDEGHVDRLDVGIDRHVIFGEVGIHDPSVTFIEDRVLEQREAHAPHDAALQLAERRLGIGSSRSITDLSFE